MQHRTVQFEGSTPYSARRTGTLPLLAIAVCAIAAVALPAASFSPGYFLLVQLAILIALFVAFERAQALNRLARRNPLARLILGLATTVLAAAFTLGILAHVFIFFPFYSVSGPRSIPAYIFVFFMAAISAYLGTWGFLIAIGVSPPTRFLALLALCRSWHRAPRSRSFAAFDFRRLTPTARCVVLVAAIASLLTIPVATYLYAGNRFGPPLPFLLMVAYLAMAPVFVFFCVAPMLLLGARLLGARLLPFKSTGHAG